MLIVKLDGSDLVAILLAIQIAIAALDRLLIVIKIAKMDTSQLTVVLPVVLPVIAV